MTAKEKILQIKNKLITKEDGNNKKTAENLIVFVIILIITIVAINYIWNDKKEEDNNNTETSKILAEEKNEINLNNEQNDDISIKLENILKSIKGVGSVKVLITYSQMSQIIPMYSEDLSEKTTEESDSRRG